MVFPALQCAAFLLEGVIKHHTTPHRAQAEGEYLAAWKNPRRLQWILHHGKILESK